MGKPKKRFRIIDSEPQHLHDDRHRSRAEGEKGYIGLISADLLDKASSFFQVLRSQCCTLSKDGYGATDWQTTAS